jgi:SAM-dependent methyltransferase
MHPEAKKFVEFVKKSLPDFFNNKIVLDVGSGDINGNNNYLFTDCEYNGNDVVKAKNVTIVSKTKDLPFNDEYFDTIISTECFEHDPTYEESIKKIYSMLKENGLFVFTCAGFGRPEHGTRRTAPNSSYGTIHKLKDMQDYYKNLTIKDINNVLDLNYNFISWNSYYNFKSKDLYFIGIKKGSGDVAITNIPHYISNKVINNKEKI